MKLLKTSFLCTALILSAYACGPKGSTVETSEAKKAATAENAVTVAVNTDNSIVTWIGSKPTGKHNGTLAISSGEIQLRGEEVVAGKFTINIRSLKDLDMEEGSEYYNKLVSHLMSPDFFDADNYPEATFEVTALRPFDPTALEADKEEVETDHTPKKLSEVMVEAPTHFVSGNLTMRGTSLNITFPAHITVDQGTVKAKANFNIDRTKWGLKYKEQAGFGAQVKDGFIYDTVNIGFELEAGTGTSL